MESLIAVPTRPPQKIKCSAESSESLRLQWNPPPHDFHNGNIQGYKIFYKPANPEIGLKKIYYIFHPFYYVIFFKIKF